MICVGIGGWTYAPWRGVFYPKGLKHAEELSYAGRHLTSIEINGTFYRLQKPESFRRWAAETPEHFVFALKAPRVTTHRRVLAEAGPSVQRFLGSGITELGSKLGPILWQFPPYTVFREDDFTAFLDLLPERWEGHRLRHAVEARHDSFGSPACIALLRQRRTAHVFVDSDKHPAIAGPTADFIYARLQRTEEKQKTGYAPAALDRWAQRVREWTDGGIPSDLPVVTPAPERQKRDCFIYFISGAKLRAPAAAMALIERVNK
jgi:uncharacterized protein YecE (DUF72 family)